MPFNLDDMSEKELKDLRTRVERAIASLETRRLDDARKAIEQAAKSHGFSLSELLASRPATRAGKSQGEPRYANPADNSQTWTGRGRQPGWIKEGLAAGKSLEDFAL